VAALNDRAPSNSRLPFAPSGRWTLPPLNDPKAEPTIHALVHGDGGPEAEDDAADEPIVDPATGFATRPAWDEVFRHEEHRFARYGRSVTLLVAELEGLNSLAAMLGQGAADRLIPPVAATMRRSARATDVLARTGRTRFVALLPETDEVAAVKYVERVCSECDMWLAAGGVAVRLAVGWAQPIAGGRLADAMRLADDRMNADRRRQSLRAAPSTAVPPSTTRT
jgi:two-component system, cell cycle response regulator